MHGKPRLRSLCPGRAAPQIRQPKSRVLVSGEVFLLTLNEEAGRAVDMIISSPPIFLRHIQPVQLEQNAEDMDQAVREVSAFLRNRKELHGAAVSLQVRKADDSLWQDSAGKLRETLAEMLSDLGADFVVQDPEWIISIFAAGSMLYAGVSRPADNLSDWSGGAIRFQREEGQISRAKFKLLEAEHSFGIDFTAFHKALDIGAAPGGWTSFCWSAVYRLQPWTRRSCMSRCRGIPRCGSSGKMPQRYNSRMRNLIFLYAI